MKKILCILMPLFLLYGCGGKNTGDDSESSPMMTIQTDAKTPDEKMLSMIQDCIQDYNEGKTEDLQKELDMTIAPLPLEVSSLPEISSLSDLEEVEDDENVTNTYYVGRQKINDKYSAVYSIYAPSGGSFWSNGSVEFEADRSMITEDDPQFARYRSVLDDLLEKQNKVLNELYTIGVEVDASSADEDGYCPVTKGPSSVQQLKDDAASVFTQDYINEVIDPVVFSGDTPIYKEKSGKLYAHPSDIIQQPSSYTYDTSCIAAVSDDGSTVMIDLLTTVMGQPQNSLKRILLIHSSDGYLLPSVY